MALTVEWQWLSLQQDVVLGVLGGGRRRDVSAAKPKTSSFVPKMLGAVGDGDRCEAMFGRDTRSAHMQDT